MRNGLCPVATAIPSTILVQLGSIKQLHLLEYVVEDPLSNTSINITALLEECMNGVHGNN